MIPPPLPPSIEELHDLCLRLKAKVERLEGAVRQLLAERTRDALPRPTWKDVEAIRQDIAALQEKVATERRT